MLIELECVEAVHFCYHFVFCAVVVIQERGINKFERCGGVLVEHRTGRNGIPDIRILEDGGGDGLECEGRAWCSPVPTGP